MHNIFGGVTAILYSWIPLVRTQFFRVPIISKCKPFPVDLPLSHSLSAISNSATWNNFSLFWEFERESSTVISCKMTVRVRVVPKELLCGDWRLDNLSGSYLPKYGLCRAGWRYAQNRDKQIILQHRKYSQSVTIVADMPKYPCLKRSISVVEVLVNKPFI